MAPHSECLLPDSLGSKASMDTQAIRERLEVGQKRAESQAPGVLPRYAQFLAACHTGLVGRIATVCRAVHVDDAKVGEALRGDRAITLFTVFKLMHHLPDVVIPAFGVAFSNYGYEVTKTPVRFSPVSKKEALVQMASAAGEFLAAGTAALDDKGFDPRFLRGLRSRFQKVERVVEYLRPHLREVA